MRERGVNRYRLGQRVRQLRLVRGWTQEELGHRAGLHPTYVGGVERGERNIGLDNLIKLARALGVRPGELFNG
jgi:transcriptional regulator with XRE-family HTH domain